MDRRNAYAILQERGFTYQTTDEEALAALFESEEVTGYIGFDATADSLHVGHLLPLMALAWMDRTGHRPIALAGGGTTMVGDPSGRTEARKLLTVEAIAANLLGVKAQVGRFLDLESGRASLMDNGEWLLSLNYVEFLRDYGKHFSVNRMIAADCYKSRLEQGLSFLEFNYMVMQAFDFLRLFELKGDKLQLGGQDQWGNIVAGIELIRRVHGGSAYGLTMPLLLDPRTGEKFGKTNAGAVWLSAERTSVYDFYQFWRDIDDQETARLLALFTFLPMEECRRLATLPGSLINRAKEVLAYEVTALVHGHGPAAEAFLASAAAFGAADPDLKIETSSRVRELAQAGSSAEVPAVSLGRAELEAADLAQLFVLAGLAASKGEARRLIRQGGAYLDDAQLSPELENAPVKGAAWLGRGEVALRAGKKRHKIVKVSN
jgi:tyrosyl-tRNA synthetase